MIRSSAVVLAIAVMSFAGAANAQLGKLKALVGGAESGEPAAVAAPDGAMQDALVNRFVTSQSHSLKAQAEFAKAFGLAEQVQMLEAERIALSSGAVDLAQMKKTVSVSESAQVAIDERLAAQPELSAEAKAHYAEGLVALLQAVMEGRKLATEASNFTAGMKTLGAVQLATMNRKLAVGAWVAKESPGYVKGLYGSTRSALTFARAAKIKTPGNAESMLDGLE